MSQRGNCHDNAVAESFFQPLKRERIRRRAHPTREDTRRNMFEYIELFYNPKCKHTNNGMLPPIGFEIKQQKLNTTGVWKSRDTSVMRLRPRPDRPRLVTQRYRATHNPSSPRSILTTDNQCASYKRSAWLTKGTSSSNTTTIRIIGITLSVLHQRVDQFGG